MYESHDICEARFQMDASHIFMQTIKCERLQKPCFQKFVSDSPVTLKVLNRNQQNWR